MKKIKLTQGKYAIVDNKDFELVSKHNWGFDNTGYAKRITYTGGIPGKVHQTRGSTKVYLHHEIIGKPPKGFVVDHINRNPLDNRRENLRFCTHSQNHGNQIKQKNNTSGYRGVSFVKRNNNWRARIKLMGKEISLGSFKTLKQAALAYNLAAQKLFGKFALLNSF